MSGWNRENETLMVGVTGKETSNLTLTHTSTHLWKEKC